MWYMSKNKFIRTAALALAVLSLSSSVAFAAETPAAPQDIIDVEQFMQEQGTAGQGVYETAVAERGTFVMEATTNAVQYYPYTYNLCFENGSAKFLTYTVKKGDEVKKGDVLARFTIDKSQAELTRLQLELQRAQEETAGGIREREQNIEATRAELAAAADAAEKEILELTLKKLEIELKQFKHSRQYTESQKQAAYNEEYARRTTDVITSPVDGVVSHLVNKNVNDAVSPNETLITLNAGDTTLYAISNENGNFRYNMPVEVQVYGRNNPVTLPGRVIAADDAIPAKERTGYALIQLDPYEGEIPTRESYPQVTAETMRLENVLLIPSQTVTWEDNLKYEAITLDQKIPAVTKLTDGMAQKRYIDLAAQSQQYAMVLSGVKEGEALILN